MKRLMGTVAAVLLTAGVMSGTAAAEAEQARQGQTPPPPVQATAEAPLDLNTADAKALQTLPGVGPAMALRILEYREKNEGFKKIEELMNIRGIGEKTFLKLKPLVAVPSKTVGW